MQAQQAAEQERREHEAVRGRHAGLQQQLGTYQTRVRIPLSLPRMRKPTPPLHLSLLHASLQLCVRGTMVCGRVQEAEWQAREAELAASENALREQLGNAQAQRDAARAQAAHLQAQASHLQAQATHLQKCAGWSPSCPLL